MTGKEKNEIERVFQNQPLGDIFKGEKTSISIFKSGSKPTEILLTGVTCLLVCISGQYEVESEGNVWVLDTMTFSLPPACNSISLVLMGKTQESELVLLTYKGDLRECFDYIDSSLCTETLPLLSKEILTNNWYNPVDFDHEAIRFFHYFKQTRIPDLILAAYYKVKFKEIWLLAISSLIFQVKKDKQVLPDDAVEQMNKVKHILSTRYSEPLTLKEIAHEVGTNEFSLKKNFKLLFGKTVFQYWTAIKMGMAHRWILDSQLNISEVAEKLGYMHATHFSAAFKKHFGYLPHTLKRH
jgi:AraC-like DNA-binding protein